VFNLENSTFSTPSVKVRNLLATPTLPIYPSEQTSADLLDHLRGSGVVGYNIQVAVDTEHHLIVTHEVTHVGINSLDV